MAPKAPASHVAYIALGSNLGDRDATLREALTRLEGRAISVETVSSLLETEAVGGPPGQGKYLNAVARVRTTRAPRELLDVLLEIERDLGRTRDPGARNQPRTVDLDLLLYEDQVIEEDGLRIPHPRMHERRFVLAPLAEIAGKMKHPVLKKSIRTLLWELPP